MDRNDGKGLETSVEEKQTRVEENDVVLGKLSQKEGCEEKEAEEGNHQEYQNAYGGPPTNCTK